MNVLVTGSSGFIGTPIVNTLRARGHGVVGFDRSHGRDVRNLDSLMDATLDVDVVVHLAGVLGTSELLDNLDAAVAVNIGGTANVLRACRAREARYIGITMPDCWPSIYQATKLAATRMAEAFANAYGLEVAHLRTFNVYGPGQAHGPGHPQKIVPTFAHAVWRGLPVPIWGDGQNTVDLVHVEDVARMFADLVDAPGVTGTFDCGTGVQSSVVDVARSVGQVIGTDSVLVEFHRMRAGELDGTRLAAKRDNAAFGFGVPYRGDYRFREAVEAYAP